MIGARLKLPSYTTIVYCIPEGFVGTGFTSEVIEAKMRRKPAGAGLEAQSQTVRDAVLLVDSMNPQVHQLLNAQILHPART